MRMYSPSMVMICGTPACGTLICGFASCAETVASAARDVSAIAISAPASRRFTSILLRLGSAPLPDLQLCERPSERCVDGGHLFVRDLLAEPRRRTGARLLDAGFVDLLGWNGHVRDDRDAAAAHLDESLAHREETVLPVLADDDFARLDLRHQPDVAGIDAHLAFDAGKRDHVHVLREHDALGRDDL